MSEKASPAAIGAFVLGAVVLIVTGLLVFGSGKFLKNTESFVLYFDGNARGLNVGAPASFRGVRIGTVNEIHLIWDNTTEKAYVETVVEIIEDSFREEFSEKGVRRHEQDESLEYLVNELGLRAKLSLQSMVTGQLYIELDLHPGAPVKLAGFKSPYRELPTLPSTMQALQNAVEIIIENLQTAPVKDLFARLDATAESIQEFLKSPQVQEVPETVHQVLVNLRDLTTKLNEQLPPLTSSLTATSAEAAAAFADVRILLQDEQGQVVRLAAELETAVQQLQGVLQQSDQLVDAVDVGTLHTMVDELSRAARSIRVFADFLERNPSAILRGKN